ncbi:hypothetical protein MMC14_006336 [Varicellaria rhodocarpa]|nr:hypothetical protein [Varicellaria rhodocarpa]
MPRMQAREAEVQDFKSALTNTVAAFEKLELLRTPDAVETGCDEFHRSLMDLQHRFRSVEAVLKEKHSQRQRLRVTSPPLPSSSGARRSGHAQPPPEIKRQPAEVQRGQKALDHITNYEGVENKDHDAAWKDVKAAAIVQSQDDLDQAIRAYSKTVPEITYDQLEQAFRRQKLPVYLIARHKEVSMGFTLRNLQGRVGCKYTVACFFSPQPPSALLAEGWPASPEENMKRLENGGVAVVSGVPGLGPTVHHRREEKGFW